MRLWWWLLLLPTVALAGAENWPERYDTGDSLSKQRFCAGIATVRERDVIDRPHAPTAGLVQPRQR